MLPQTEIVLWTTPEGPPKASQASECSELLDLTRAAYLIAAQRQPGKFTTRAQCGVRRTPCSSRPQLRVTIGGIPSHKKLSNSHECAPSTATFSKRRNVGARNAGGAATAAESEVVPGPSLCARHRTLCSELHIAQPDICLRKKLKRSSTQPLETSGAKRVPQNRRYRSSSRVWEFV